MVEQRQRIKLADNEAVILKDGEGKYHFRSEGIIACVTYDVWSRCT